MDSPPPAKSRIRAKADPANKERAKTLVVVLENPGNQSNVGAVIRSVDGLGARALYVVNPPDSKFRMPDWPESRSQKGPLACSSSSANKWTFVKVFSSTTECHDHLEGLGYTSYVTSPHRKDKPCYNLHDGKYTDRRVAVWFGNESKGITDEAVARAKGCIAIPMRGMVESFNLSVSVGIVLSEVVRQRREHCAKKWSDRDRPDDLDLV